MVPSVLFSSVPMHSFLSHSFRMQQILFGGPRNVVVTGLMQFPHEAYRLEGEVGVKTPTTDFYPCDKVIFFYHCSKGMKVQCRVP